MDEKGVYDNSTSQPNVEGNSVDGDGAGSASATGGNKRDPLSAAPTLGATIAGREINTGAPGDLTNPGINAPESVTAESDEGTRRQSGGTDTGGQGVTGHTGKSDGSGHAVPGDGSVDGGE